MHPLLACIPNACNLTMHASAVHLQCCTVSITHRACFLTTCASSLITMGATSPCMHLHHASILTMLSYHVCILRLPWGYLILHACICTMHRSSPCVLSHLLCILTDHHGVTSLCMHLYHAWILTTCAFLSCLQDNNKNNLMEFSSTPIVTFRQLSTLPHCYFWQRNFNSVLLLFFLQCMQAISLIFISVYLILHVCKPFAFVSWLIKAITYLLVACFPCSHPLLTFHQCHPALLMAIPSSCWHPLFLPMISVLPPLRWAPLQQTPSMHSHLGIPISWIDHSKIPYPIYVCNCAHVSSHVPRFAIVGFSW